MRLLPPPPPKNTQTSTHTHTHLLPDRAGTSHNGPMTYKPQLRRNYSQAFKSDSIKNQTAQARVRAEHRLRPKTWRPGLIISMALGHLQSGIFFVPDTGRSEEGSLLKVTLSLAPSAQERTRCCHWNFAEGAQQAAESHDWQGYRW